MPIARLGYLMNLLVLVKGMTGLSEVKIAPNHSDFSKLRNAQIHKSSLTFVIAPQYSFKATVSNFNGKVS